MLLKKCLSGSALVLALLAMVSAAPHAPGEPFKAMGAATSITVTGGPPPAPLSFEILAQGNATHLGKYTSDAQFVVTFVSATQAVFDGGGTLTAANGDQVDFVMSGDFFPGPVPGGVGHFTITGGSGRFANASGGGEFVSMGGETIFDGTINR